MVDMGQADRTLREKPKLRDEKVWTDWTIALRRAAEEMGYRSYEDVPEERVEDLKAIARQIQKEY